jgi:tetratricopeptide (TPR) repeat protein
MTTTASALPPDSRLHGLSPTAIRSVVAAATALDRGQADAADHHLIGLLALYPEHPEVLRLLAGLQSLHGDAFDAIATMRRALAKRPNDALYHNTLGTALLAADDYDAAVSSLVRASELDPKLTTAWYNLGLALMRAMRPVESAAALRQAAALSPQHFGARILLADMLKAQGRLDEAIAEYRRVLGAQPYAGMAWWGLADIKTVRFEDADTEALVLALRDARAGDDDRIAMGFALAKAWDERDRYADSLAELARANAIARRRQHWDATAHSAWIDALIEAFSPPLAQPTQSTLGGEVIFIASMPRSGSSLIEHVLASHSQVDGAGELADLPLVLTEESRRIGKPIWQWARDAGAEDWQRLGIRYLERTARWRERRPRFTDKLPGNWMYVGAIRRMLPGARIVIGRRDALETCLSCYRQRLVGNEYTRTFGDLARYWRDFDRAVRRWHALYSENVYANVYEDLVADPEAGIRTLLAFCDLPFEPACLEFHLTEREVHTPSAAQVREPLRRDTARASRYGALLDPLRVELGLHPIGASSSPA